MMQLIFAVFFLVLALKIVGLLLKICGKAVGIILSLIGFVLSLAFGMAMFGLSMAFGSSVVCVGVSGAGGEDYFIKNPL